jgi:hypothetical protein
MDANKGELIRVRSRQFVVRKHRFSNREWTLMDANKGELIRVRSRQFVVPTW